MIKRKISAKIIADSISPKGHRITSFILTYPRSIHGELMTHRMFSRNSASSRAMPFKKMVKMAQDDPFIPIAWQKEHTGMQGTEYFEDEEYVEGLITEWLFTKDLVVQRASKLSEKSASKQICNRLLEPFMWHTVLVTATEWENFFELRCPAFDYLNVKIYRSRKDAIRETKASLFYGDWYSWQRMNKSQAEIHIQALAEVMWDAMNENAPRPLQPGEWHIPFGDNIDAANFVNNNIHTLFNNGKGILQNSKEVELKVAVARCARLSYMTFDGDIDYEKDIKLFDHLYRSKHMSPFEHVARCMTEKEYDSFIKGEMFIEDQGEGVKYIAMSPYVHGWCNNFKGWIPYRYLIETL